MQTISKCTQNKNANGKMSFLRLPLNKENEMILNTPKRKEILKDGPPLSQVKNNLLGRGAYGTVIKAIYKAKPVAVKIIKNLKNANNQIMLNESHILSWQHVNIVQILKIESTANFAIVIMERFNGQCLQNTIDNMEIPIMHRIYITLDILSGLMYCHKRDLLHMDIKPQNIMISLKDSQPYIRKSNSTGKSYICKLCDFGSSLKIWDQTRNTKGLIKGTLRYMSPEALKEEQLTTSTDIYSLGITLWQMKYRKLPYNWLQCNDVVAYQVVKYNLRPNALQGKENQLNTPNNCNTTNNIIANNHELCLCKTKSIPISVNSLENLLNILQSTECELLTARKPNENVAIKRMPLKELNNNKQKNIKTLKVKRNLENEFSSRENFGLAKVLHCTLQLDVAKQNLLEELYENVYTSCWHSDFQQRPNAVRLYKCFKDLL